MGIICCYDSGKRKLICFQEKNRKPEKKEKNKEYLNQSITSENRSKNSNLRSTNKNQEISTIKINNQKLKEFLSSKIYQGQQNSTSDASYNELIKLETKELNNEVDILNDELIKKIAKLFNFQKIKNEVVKEIIKSEITDSMIKRKIASMVEQYEKEKDKYSIPYLKIMLVGRKNIGKTSLINYMLKLEPQENTNKNSDLQEYSSDIVPFIKLVEYKGIGFDQDSNPELIGTKIVNYISNLQKMNYKNFIHCIWYCITETKFEVPEIAVLKKLKTSYNDDNVLPVIVVYTKTESHDIANKMETHIKNRNINTIFIKTLAKSFEMKNGKIKEAFGREELLQKTLQKCTSSLQSELINLMINNISEEIKNEILEEYNKKIQKIKENIVDKFVSEYNQVKDDCELIDYIINIIIENLKELNEGYVSNRCFNLLNESVFINEVKNKVNSYKEKIKELIDSKIEKNAINFLDIQAKNEINNGNMKIEHKKELKELKKTIEIYFKKNLYYNSQRIMIAYILENIYFAFFDDLNEKLSEKVNDILKVKKNQDIKELLEHIFLIKLKDFGDKWGIDIQNIIIKNKNFDFPDKQEIRKDCQRKSNNDLITNSFNDNINDNSDKGNNKKKIENNDLEKNNWFPINRNKSWKYIKDKEKILEQFLQSLEIQDNFFNIKTNDQIFEYFKEYMKKELITILNDKKIEFIKNIDNAYLKKKVPFEEQIITKIIEKEDISSIYDKLIENEISELNNNIGLIKIDYMTILVVGRSGIGKSVLIKEMTKKYVPNGVGIRVTLLNDIYKGEAKLSFLKMIDTRGTELNTEIGLDKIRKNVEDVIKNQKLEAKEKNDFNNNIQCIYYCVKGSSLEESEIKTIEKIKENKESIPVIVVFTMGINNDDIKKMEDLISSRLDLPFISVLAEKNEDLDSYGLNDLLNLTLDQCQKSQKGNMFQTIKEIICKNVIEKLEEINKKIKFSLNNNMLKKFVNFKKAENDLYQLIHDYIEIAIIEYNNLSGNNITKLKEESNEEFEKLKSLNDYIKEFIGFYTDKSQEIIEPILDNLSLEFLDTQVRKEKESSKSIEIENKNDRDSFKTIIKDFLEPNFYYISQKYLIYKLFYDFSEPFSEDLEKKVNDIVKKNLKKNEINEKIKKSYEDIFNAFRKSIENRARNGKIYPENNPNENKYNYGGCGRPKNFKQNEPKDSNLDCPYPSFNH